MYTHFIGIVMGMREMGIYGAEKEIKVMRNKCCGR